MFKKRMLACYDRLIDKTQQKLKKIQEELNEVEQSKKEFESQYANLDQKELEEINFQYASTNENTPDEVMIKNLIYRISVLHSERKL